MSSSERAEGRRPIYVIGAGGLAREMAQLIEQIDTSEDRWEFGGFVAAPGHRDAGGARKLDVVGDDDWLLSTAPDADVVIGIGYPTIRADVVNRYVEKGARFRYPNLIHPSAIVDVQRVSLGRGNVVTAGTVLTCDIEIGDFNLLNWHVTVGHDARIGSCCVLNPGANISGGVVVNDRVLIGTGAQILENRLIGPGATIGAGAVVTRDVAPGDTVVGVPARPLRPG